MDRELRLARGSVVFRASGAGQRAALAADPTRIMKAVVRRAIFGAILAVFPVLLACGGGEATPERTAPPRDTASPSARKASPASLPRRADLDAAPRIIFLGDSLTAGLGLDVEDSFPSLIQQRLDQAATAFAVVNAGVSGDTSAGGLRRLDWAMGEGESEVLIVALGGNDGLRGLPPEQLEANLAAIIEQGQSGADA